MNKRLEPVYQKFALTFVPELAGDGQREDIRAAFFYGATALYSMIDDTFNAPDASPESINRLRDDLIAEINHFLQSEELRMGEYQEVAAVALKH